MNNHIRFLREIERQRWLDEFSQITQIYSNIVTIAMNEIEREKRKVALVSYWDGPIFWSDFFIVNDMEARTGFSLEENRNHWVRMTSDWGGFLVYLNFKGRLK